jgi:hypothetical protein
MEKFFLSKELLNENELRDLFHNIIQLVMMI